MVSTTGDRLYAQTADHSPRESGDKVTFVRSKGGVERKEENLKARNRQVN